MACGWNRDLAFEGPMSYTLTLVSMCTVALPSFRKRLGAITGWQLFSGRFFVPVVSHVMFLYSIDTRAYMLAIQLLLSDRFPINMYSDY